MATLHIREESELARVGEGLLGALSSIPGGHVLALKGDLGAGKTALTKALARTLGVKEEITSPTFVIMKSYVIPTHPVFHTFTHIDAYRIEDEEELVVLGIPERLAREDELVIIEWPERMLGLLPPETLTASLMIATGNDRLITYAD
jgi:tRNA threonylcarbamoyladenosine biosynthesis protein TsaE